MAFQFLRFTVEDRMSTLRVGTDAMLLGAWAEPGDAKRILDIGTGCGVLALMIAQRSDATVDAIEPDGPSAGEAAGNFAASPWSGRLSAIRQSLQEFVAVPQSPYDLIITNPPYFSNSLKSPSARKTQARHDSSLTFTELAGASAQLLAPAGRLAVILPACRSAEFETTASEFGLFPLRRLVVRPRPHASPNRLLTEFSRTQKPEEDPRYLSILGDDGNFSPEYLALTAGYHKFYR